MKADRLLRRLKRDVGGLGPSGNDGSSEKPFDTV